MGTELDGPPPRRPSLRYVAGVTAVAAAAIAAPDGGPPGPGQHDPMLIWAGAALGALVLVLLRRRPAWAVAVTLVLAYGAQLATGAPTGLVVLVLAALFVAALRLPLRAAVVLLTVSAATCVVVDAATGGWDSRVLAPVAFMAAVTGAGAVVSAQRALLRSAAERVAAAERTKRHEAALAVADERLRIARELHDVVAHHVAVMGIQAGAAEQLLDTDRDQVRAALAQVRASGRTALTELGAVVGLLRARTGAVHPDEHDEDVGLLRPVAAGLSQLPDLLQTVRAAGLDVTVTGLPDRPGDLGLTEFADLAAYRIVQESLTNAIRHGTGSATLTLTATPAAVTITATNPLPDQAVAPTGDGTGHGLLGMRERAALVGAQLIAGPDDDGTFTVRVELPASRVGQP